MNYAKTRHQTRQSVISLFLSHGTRDALLLSSLWKDFHSFPFIINGISDFYFVSVLSAIIQAGRRGKVAGLSPQLGIGEDVLSNLRCATKRKWNMQ